jgi:hypothetical protein
MRIIFALAALAIPLASSPAHGPVAKSSFSPLPSDATPLGGPGCRRPNVHPADSAGEGTFNRLGELPPGQLVLTVFREVNGCPEPVIVGRNYGLGLQTPDPAHVRPPLRARRW